MGFSGYIGSPIFRFQSTKPSVTGPDLPSESVIDRVVNSDSRRLMTGNDTGRFLAALSGISARKFTSGVSHLTTPIPTAVLHEQLAARRKNEKSFRQFAEAKLD